MILLRGQPSCAVLMAPPRSSSGECLASPLALHILSKPFRGSLQACHLYFLSLLSISFRQNLDQVSHVMVFPPTSKDWTHASVYLFAKKQMSSPTQGNVPLRPQPSSVLFQLFQLCTALGLSLMSWARVPSNPRAPGPRSCKQKASWQ